MGPASRCCTSRVTCPNAGETRRRGYASPSPAAAACLLEEGGPVRIASLPGRGRGLIACRDITRGEIVLTEAPLISVPAAIDALDGADAAAELLAADISASWRVREANSGVARPLTEQLDVSLSSVGGRSGESPPQQFPRIAMRALLLLQETPELWEELKHLCSPRLEGPAPEEWLDMFARVRDVATADEESQVEGVDGAGSGSSSLVPFDSLLSSQVWCHLIGAAHLNTFKLQYPTTATTACSTY